MGMEKKAKRKKETKIELMKLQEKGSILNAIIRYIFYTFLYVSMRYRDDIPFFSFFFSYDVDKFNARFISFQPPF